jgi:xanthine dehydrogenase iron-sulfur cluster and FAD-binding subunit A
MSKCYYINLSRKEIAIVSYFPAWELKNKPKAEWIETVLIPLPSSKPPFLFGLK